MQIQSVVYPDTVPANFRQWYNYHFHHQPANFVPFSERSPAPNVRYNFVVQLCIKYNYTRLAKKFGWV